MRVDARGMPRVLTLRRRRHDVARVADVWRIDDEWWRSRPLHRLYFRLILKDGQIVTVYRELGEAAWYLQRDSGGY